jgi:hypothetical protein
MFWNGSTTIDGFWDSAGGGLGGSAAFRVSADAAKAFAGHGAVQPLSVAAVADCPA